MRRPCSSHVPGPGAVANFCFSPPITELVVRWGKTATTGKQPGGRPPAPPVAGPLPKDQINLTDEDSRIMPVAGGGFEQCYNAQAAVAAGSLLVVADRTDA